MDADRVWKDMGQTDMELSFDIKILQSKKLAVYGTGENARRFLEEYGQRLNVVGVIDPAKTGECFLQKSVLPIEGAVETVECILVCASMRAELIIYNRIGALCSEKGMELYGINGGNLYEFYGVGFNQKVSAEELWKQIDLHEVISFDLFDTLLTRLTLYPADVYSIVQSRMEQEGIEFDNFYFNRIQTELELVNTKRFLLDEIYNRLQIIYSFDHETKARIKEMELQAERDVSTSRKAISDAFSYAVSKGKRVFILTDMYLPKTFLEELLDRQGIGGYEDILVSGELQINKCNGMYSYFKELTGSTNILHIGDNIISDGYFARKEGLDVDIIPSVREVLRKSEYGNLMNYSGGDSENLTIGMFAAAAFRNSVTQTRVKPEIMTEYAALFLAPLVTGFVIWIASEVRGKSCEKVLFSARDGFLLMELYETLRRLHPEYGLPEGIYLYASRKAVWHVYENNPDKEDRNKNYIQYLRRLKLKKEKRYVFVDLISRGTIQAALETLFFNRLDGLYLVQYTGAAGHQNDICIHSLYRESPITNMEFSESSNLALETFLTSMEPSLREVGKNGRLIFQKEFRTGIQLEMIRNVQQVIRDYFETFCKLNDMESCNRELIREIWRSRKKADIKRMEKVIKNMKIEDSLNQNQLFFVNQL